MMEFLTNPPGITGLVALVAGVAAGFLAIIGFVTAVGLRGRVKKSAAEAAALSEKLNEMQESLAKKIDLAKLSLTQVVEEVKSSVPVQLDEARAEMNAAVDEKVSGLQSSLTQKIEEVELSVAQSVAGVEVRLEQAKAETQSVLDQKLSVAQATANQRLKEAESTLDHRMRDLESSVLRKADEAAAQAGSARTAAEGARQQADDVMDRLARFEDYFRTVFETKFAGSFAHFDKTVVEVLGHMREELQRGLNRVDQMHAMVENRGSTEDDLLASQQEAQQLLAEGQAEESAEEQPSADT
ncbi:MAG: hypothetical protein GXP25_09130 [Planctomycetes bacterium]|nr:hypothetical protein [Planctomycetota bacterium]